MQKDLRPGTREAILSLKLCCHRTRQLRNCFQNTAKVCNMSPTETHNESDSLWRFHYRLLCVLALVQLLSGSWLALQYCLPVFVHLQFYDDHLMKTIHWITVTPYCTWLSVKQFVFPWPPHSTEVFLRNILRLLDPYFDSKSCTRNNGMTLWKTDKEYSAYPITSPFSDRQKGKKKNSDEKNLNF